MDLSSELQLDELLNLCNRVKLGNFIITKIFQLGFFIWCKLVNVNLCNLVQLYEFSTVRKITVVLKLERLRNLECV